MNANRTLTVLVAVLVVGGVPSALAASTAGTQATAGDAVHVQDDAVYAQDETTTEDDGANQTTAAGESQVTNVTFADQTSNGTAVVVQQVAIQTTKPAGGFVSIHLAENVSEDGMDGATTEDGTDEVTTETADGVEDTVTETAEGDAMNVTEDMIGARIGNSTFLDPGEYQNLTVELNETLAEDTTLIAVVHRDSQGDEQFDPEADQAFEVDGQIVAAAANVTVSATDDGGATVGAETTTEDDEEA